MADIRPNMAHYLAAFLNSGHEVPPGKRLRRRRLAVLTHSGRNPNHPIALAAFRMVAVCGPRPYLRCAKLGLKQGWHCDVMTLESDGCIGPPLALGADGISGAGTKTSCS